MNGDAFEQLAQRVRDASWLDPDDCPHCGGSGSAETGRRMVHCSGGFTGADWTVESVLACIRTAREVGWVDGFNRHHLRVIDADGKQWTFQVPKPS